MDNVIKKMYYNIEEGLTSARKLFKKTSKNFYDLAFWEAFYYIGYNLYFVPFYFLYVLATFSDQLSENTKMYGGLLSAVVIGVLIIVSRIKKKGRPFGLIKK